MSETAAYRLRGEVESPRPLRARAGLVSLTGWCLVEGLAEPPAVRLVTTAGSLALASLFLAPLAWATWPSTPPSARAWAEMAFLGIASSGLGMWMYFRLLRRIGTVPAMSVTFLSPLVAMVSGALYLGEAITLQMVAGCAVVLLGTALSLGLIGGPASKAQARGGA